MSKHLAVYITQRSPRHQQVALQAAPPELDIAMLESPSRDEIMARLPDAEFLISERSGPVDTEMLAAGRRLRLVQRLGTLTHDIDLDAARQAQVPVCYWPLSGCVMVAEHVVTQILALAKRLREVSHVATEAGDWGQEPRPCDQNYFAYNWSGRTGFRHLADSTVGIVGLGEIGSEVARRLRGFGTRVLYYKRNALPAPVEEELNVDYAPLEELKARSDFLCMLLPHSAATAQMVNRAFLSGIKPGACLISTGASTLVNEAEVAEVFREGRLGGLATDGYVREPIAADNPLLALTRDPMANVVLTPHTAAGEHSGSLEMRIPEYTNLRRVLSGEPLQYRLA